MLMRATAHAVAFRFPVHKNARFHGCEWKREQLAARNRPVFLAEVSKISSLARNRLLFLAVVRDICYICVIKVSS